MSRDAISDKAPFQASYRRNAQISIVNKHLSSLSLSSHSLPFNLSIYQPIPPTTPSITLSRSLLKCRRCSRLWINHPSTSPNEYRCCPHLKGGFSSNLSFSPSSRHHFSEEREQSRLLHYLQTNLTVFCSVNNRLHPPP